MPLRSAVSELWRRGQSLFIDLRYGRPIGGAAKPKPQVYAELGAYGFTNTGYGLLAEMFEGHIAPDDILVDVGSGRGRVLNFWLHAGHRAPIFGLELDVQYARESARRLRGWPNVQVRQGDAIANLPAEGTLFFLFNPFNAIVMRSFRDALRQRAVDIRLVRVIYYAPTCIEVWSEDPFWRVEVHELDLSGIRWHAERHRTYALIVPADAQQWPTSGRNAIRLT